MKDKRNILLIAGLALVVGTLLFFVLEVGPLFIAAYAFLVLGIAGAVVCSFMMLDKPEHYPWSATLPIEALRYLGLETLLSTAAVVLDQLGIFSVPLLWYLAGHVAILAIFIARIIMLRGAMDHIGERDRVVKGKVFFVKSLLADIEGMERRTANADMKEKLRALADTVRYSDPMSAEELWELEESIAQKTGALAMAEGSGAEGLIAEIEQLLQDRNAQCRLLK